MEWWTPLEEGEGLKHWRIHSNCSVGRNSKFVVVEFAVNCSSSDTRCETGTECSCYCEKDR